MHLNQIPKMPAWKGWLILTLTAVACVSIQIWRADARWGYDGGFQIPLSFGIVKDVLDAVIVLLYVWGAWPVAMIELLGRVLRLGFLWRFWMCAIAGGAYGIVSTFRSFEIVTSSRVVTGIATYELIFGMSLLVSWFVIQASMFIYSRIKCFQPK